jgi:hypothetical protein
MPTTTIEAMAERLERLERECRCWRRAGVGLALIGVVVLTIGAVRKDEGPKTIEAERFLLKDKDGTIRGEWEIDPKLGWTNFRMNNGKCDRQIEMLVTRSRAEDGNGIPTINLHAKDGRGRINMLVTPDGEGRLYFHDGHGNIVLRLPSALIDPPPPPPVGVPFPPPNPAPGPANPAKNTRAE